jgi:flagellar biosynthesis protein FlhF
MRLRVFRARRMAEAMAQLRAELGDEAVILGSRRVADGVEVTAALDPAEPLLIPPCLPEVPPAWPIGDLGRHNLPPALAAALSAGPQAGLAARLAGRLAFRPLPPGRPRPLALVGPPGAGKTLTCAKLAARQVRGGVRPLVISTDHARAGAAEQIAAFTRLLGLMLALAETPGTLAKARAHAAPDQPVLVDTEGCDPFDDAQARALLALLRSIEAEVVLVLPAGLDPGEAAELARGFALLGARHLLPTRLDQARRMGGVLAAAAAAGLALAEAGTGPGAADGLTAVTPDWLAERLLSGMRRGSDAPGGAGTG